MYIKSDYKEQFFDFLRSSSLSPISIRAIRSDVRSLFVWLAAFQYQYSVSAVREEYRTHLLLSNTPSTVLSRKISSVDRFLSWVSNEFPGAIPSAGQQTKVYRPPSYSKHLLKKPQSYAPYVFVVIVVISLFALSYQLISSTYQKGYGQLGGGIKKDVVNNQIFYFDLLFDSEVGASDRAKSYLTFKFYSDSQHSNSMGYVSCPIQESMFDKEPRRLKILVGSNCGVIPPKVENHVSLNKEIFTEIFMNENHISDVSLSPSNSSLTNLESSLPDDMIVGHRIPGKTEFSLPKALISDDILGVGTVSTSSASMESIPLSIFKLAPPVEDGEIVSIYQESLVRALLSTKVLGVKFGDAIITKGITFVKVVEGPESVIHAGDYISTSSSPGYAQKALSGYDSVLGVALEDYLPGNVYLKVLVSL